MSDRLLPEVPDADVEPAAPAALVVGHDGSDCASRALETALQLATELGAPVTVVRAWSMVTAPRPEGWTFGTVPSTDELAAAVEAELQADLAPLLGRFPGVEVTCRDYHAGPVRSLIEASRDARMLVVGSRGVGGLREMVLGSVSDQCVRYASCPVLVVRDRSQD
jgi:nucleotide-binding universal stress UspA family protein